MNFWTQLSSECTAISNVIGLVSFGATIGINTIGLNDEYNPTIITIEYLTIINYI